MICTRLVPALLRIVELDTKCDLLAADLTIWTHGTIKWTAAKLKR
jgi:hypothetical protein